MSGVATQTKHSNIGKVVLRRIKKYYGRKAKNILEEKKQKYKAYFEGETGIFIIKKILRDIMQRRRVPETIELRKKLGYSHYDIMVWKETLLAEKIIKLFPRENIVLNKKINNRKPDIWLKTHNLIIKVDEKNH